VPTGVPTLEYGTACTGDCARSRESVCTGLTFRITGDGDTEVADMDCCCCEVTLVAVPCTACWFPAAGMVVFCPCAATTLVGLALRGCATEWPWLLGATDELWLPIGREGTGEPWIVRNGTESLRHMESLWGTAFAHSTWELLLVGGGAAQDPLREPPPPCEEAVEHAAQEVNGAGGVEGCTEG